MATPESALVEGCLVVLHKVGALVWRQNQGAVKIGKRLVRFTRGVKGISDVIGLFSDGQFCAVECKRRPNKLTANQLAFIADVRKHGGFAVCVYSVDELTEALARRL